MICLLCYNELSGLCVHLYDSSSMQQTVLIIQWLSRATLARRLAELTQSNIVTIFSESIDIARSLQITPAPFVPDLSCSD